MMTSCHVDLFVLRTHSGENQSNVVPFTKDQYMLLAKCWTNNRVVIFRQRGDNVKSLQCSKGVVLLNTNMIGILPSTYLFSTLPLVYFPKLYPNSLHHRWSEYNNWTSVISWYYFPIWTVNVNAMQIHSRAQHAKDILYLTRINTNCDLFAWCFVP